MTSNPRPPEPEWPATGPVSPDPLDGLPAAGDGFGPPDGSWAAGPQVPRPAGPQGGWPDGHRWPPEPGPAPLVAAGDERLATLGYLSVPFLGPLAALALYLVKKRRSPFVGRHAAQALNLAITALIYTFCALILGIVLALDSISLALVVVLPLAVVLWVATLVYVILAASGASRGTYYRIPAWLCAALIH